MGRIQNDDVDLGFSQRLDSVEHIRCNAYAGTAQKTALSVLGGVGIFNILLNILDRDKTDKVIVVIDNRKLLFLGLGKDLLRFFESDPLPGGNKSFRGH